MSILLTPRQLRHASKVEFDHCTVTIPCGDVGGSLFALTRFPLEIEIKLEGKDADRFAPLLASAEALIPSDVTFETNPLPQRMNLKAARDAVAAYRKKLAAFPRPWIGFSYMGGAPDDDIRNLTPYYCGPELKTMPGTLVDIQHVPDKNTGRAEKMRQFFAGVEIPLVRLDGFDPIGDLPDAAALIQALDAVLTVNNSNAYLAPALGIPTYLMTRVMQPGGAYPLLSDILNPGAWATLHVIAP